MNQNHIKILYLLKHETNPTIGIEIFYKLVDRVAELCMLGVVYKAAVRAASATMLCYLMEVIDYATA